MDIDGINVNVDWGYSKYKICVETQRLITKTGLFAFICKIIL